MDSRSAAAEIASRVYAERAAKCTAEQRRAARDFLDLRNGAGFDEQLRLDAYTLECRRCCSLPAECVGEPEPSGNALACAAIERGLAVVDFGGGEVYRIPSRHKEL